LIAKMEKQKHREYQSNSEKKNLWALLLIHSHW
jgi:hypothetical protein